MRIAEIEYLPADALTNWHEAKAWTTGSEDLDVGRGAVFADVAIKLAKQDGTCMPLAVIVADIVRGGELGPFEAGFIARVCNLARVGSMD